MACDITDLQIVGHQIDPQGRVAVLELVGRVIDCPSLNLILDVSFTGQSFSTTATASSTPASGSGGYHVFSAYINIDYTASCGDTVTFRAACADDPTTCFKTADVKIVCKPGTSTCPTQCMIRVAGPLPSTSPVSSTDACVPPGTYRATVIEPVGSGITYWWQEQTGSSFSQPVNDGVTHDVAAPAGDDLFQVLVSASVPNCPPLAGAFQFPARNAGACPQTATLTVKRNGTMVPPPYTALPPGDYILEATATPSGPGFNYSFADAGTAGTPFSPNNTFPVTLTAGDAPRTISAIVQAGPCCPPLISEPVTLGAEATTGTPPGDDTSDDNGSNDDDTSTETPPALPSICGWLRGLLIVLLLTTVILVDFAMCPLPPNAGLLTTASAAFAAALVVLALLAAHCRWAACRIVGALTWASMWGFLFSIPIALWCNSLATFFAGIVFAIMAGLLVLWLNANRCRIPTPIQWP